MKRPPQIAEELEEKEVDKLLFLEVLTFFYSYFLFTGEEEEAGPDSILYSWS